MYGHEICHLPCTYCHRNASEIDAIWDDGLPYHDSCYKLSLSNELKQYQKKVSLGTITLSESNRMNDLQSTFNLIRDYNKRPTILIKSKRSELITRSGNSVFFSEDRRNRMIEEINKIKEQSLLIQNKIIEDKLLAENNNNSYISDGKLKKIVGLNRA